MRNVLKNSDEVAHFWANAVQESGRAASSSFDGGVLYSYSAIIAIRVTPSVAIFTGGSYSVTTSKHTSRARGAFYGIGRTSVSAPRRLDARSTPASVRAAWQEKIEELAVDYRLQTRKPSKAKALRALNETVKKANALNAACDLPLFEEVPGDADVEAYVLSIAAKREEATRLHRIAVEEREARALEEARENIEKWKAGEDVSPFGFSRFRSVVGDLLRVSPYMREDDEVSKDITTQVVETSQRVEVPLSHVVTQAPLLMRLVRSGKVWETNGRTIHLGHFKVDRIDADGTLHAGCHVFKREELERFASVLGVE